MLRSRPTGRAKRIMTATVLERGDFLALFWPTDQSWRTGRVEGAPSVERGVQAGSHGACRCFLGLSARHFMQRRIGWRALDAGAFNGGGRLNSKTGRLDGGSACSGEHGLA